MRLLLYPDPGLRRPAEPVEGFGSDLDPVINGVEAIMGQAGAIGLSAAHCDVPLRVVVVKPPGGERVVFVNPIVLEASQETLEHEEGSVSMPGVRAMVTRSARIRIAFQDRDAVRHQRTLDGFDAAIILHEIDQLDGIFWLDRLSRLKRDRLVKRYEKLSRPATSAERTGPMAPSRSAGRAR